MMATLQEQLAAQGLALPPQPAPPPQTDLGGGMSMGPIQVGAAPPAMTVGPISVAPGAPAQSILPPGAKILSASRAAPTGLDANVDTSTMNAIGPLDVGMLRRRAAAPIGPDLNVDTSGMNSEKRIGAEPPAAPASLRAQVAGPRLDPTANEAAATKGAQGRIGDVLSVKQELGEQGFAAAGKRADEAQGFADEAQARQARHNAALEDAQSAIDAASKDVAGDKINAHRLIDSASFAQHAQRFIGAIMGGFLQGFQGRATNPFLDQLNTQIGHDIDEQRENHATKAKAVDAKQQTFSNLVHRLGSEDAAVNAQHAIYLEGVKAQGDQRAALSGNADDQARWADQANALDLEIARRRDAAAQGAAKAASAGSKPDWKAQHEMSKEAQEAGLPAMNAGLSRLNDITAANGGEAPVGALRNRLALGAAHALGDGLWGHLASGIATPEAREQNNIITGLAEGMAHANGQRGVEAVNMNADMLKGNGSAVDLAAGAARVRRAIESQQRNIFMGQDPRQVLLQQQMAAGYGGGDAAPPPPAAAPGSFRR